MMPISPIGKILAAVCEARASQPERGALYEVAISFSPAGLREAREDDSFAPPLFRRNVLNDREEIFGCPFSVARGQCQPFKTGVVRARGRK